MRKAIFQAVERSEKAIKAKGMDRIKSILSDTGAMAGSESFFSDRLTVEDGMPMLIRQDGFPVVIDSDSVREALPPGLIPASRATQQDDLGRLDRLIADDQEKLSELQRRFNESGGHGWAQKARP